MQTSKRLRKGSVTYRFVHEKSRGDVSGLGLGGDGVGEFAAVTFLRAKNR